MSVEKVDYMSIIVDLEAKKAAIEATIVSVRSAMAIGALGQIGESSVIGTPTPLTEHPVELPTGALLGKSLPAAIKLYLSAIKKKQTIREITAALREGGVESTSASFETVITGALNRMKGAGEVLRFKDGWGLAEFYPESLRSRLSVTGKPTKKKSKRTKRKLHRSGAEGSNLQVVESTPGPQKVIEKYVSSQGACRITSADVSKALNMRLQTVALVLSKLAHAGAITKNPDGSFDVQDRQLVN